MSLLVLYIDSDSAAHRLAVVRGRVGRLTVRARLSRSSAVRRLLGLLATDRARSTSAALVRRRSSGDWLTGVEACIIRRLDQSRAGRGRRLHRRWRPSSLSLRLLEVDRDRVHGSLLGATAAPEQERGEEEEQGDAADD